MKTTQVISLGYNVLLIGSLESEDGLTGESASVVVSNPGRTSIYGTAKDYEEAATLFTKLAIQARLNESPASSGCGNDCKCAGSVNTRSF